MTIKSIVKGIFGEDESNQVQETDDKVDHGTAMHKATIAAGCFWSVELAYQRLPGVTSTKVGYANGNSPNPTYKQVCSGNSGYVEAVQIEFDADVISYDEVLDKFWSIHNPTTLNRQKNDVGTQYRSGIYYHTPEQAKVAAASKASKQTEWKDEIVTEVKALDVFYPAEEYHQEYLKKGGQCASKGCNDSIRCYG